MPTDLDDADYRILHQLQGNARLSNKALAERVALSASPCWRRVRELEDQGVIADYVTRLDRHQLGYRILALASVSLENHHTESVAAFDGAIQTWPEVLECHKISGAYDYMLKVVAEDLASYDEFISNRVLQLSCVRELNTTFSMREMKSTTRLPLPGDTWAR
ncbi:MAG: Lrp/AsnC family transcriptional regulator [Pseudomonadota bacterium]